MKIRRDYMDKTTFDNIIRENLINAASIDHLDTNSYSDEYPNYYNNSAFTSFVDQMKCDYKSAYAKYINGKGSELKPQKSAPPKMASVASSSRFCYLALRDGAEVLGGKDAVEFEYSCKNIKGIRGGTPPQMDAYIANDNIFVEVKCHEIFDTHKIVLSKQYKDLLCGQNSDFGFSSITEYSEKEIAISSNEFGLKEDTAMFDTKQFICHLLGIKSNKDKDEKATLIYLFFKPKTPNLEQQSEIDRIFEELKDEIKNVFNNKSIQNFIRVNNIQLKAVAEYAEVMSSLTKDNMIILY